jgi:dinuclear metal center YbgI/SA1388 family protein
VHPQGRTLFSLCDNDMASRQPTVRVQDITGLLNRLYPPQFAEDWDNVGLQVGDPQSAVEKILVCLDPTRAALEQAAADSAQLVISHHPLIFRPLKSLTPTDSTGQLIWQAARAGIAVASVHTNLDRARPGLNDWLAAKLQLSDYVPLQFGQGQELFKLVVFVPETHLDQVAEALFGAGAGQIGNYDRCSFRTAGTGTFRAGSGSEPFIGRQGEMSSVDEIRFEALVPTERLARVTQKLLKAHPYEEVAYDLLPLANRREDIGLGRIGRLAQPVALEAFAGQVKGALGCNALRWVGEPARPVSKVALCGGSGASLLADAVRQGADVLVTGDVKYHDAKIAQDLKIGLIDAGHFATEHLMVEQLAATLQQAVAERSWSLEVVPMTGESDPFQYKS